MVVLLVRPGAHHSLEITLTYAGISEAGLRGATTLTHPLGLDQGSRTPYSYHESPGADRQETLRQG